jgi:adenylate cyclase class 2
VERPSLETELKIPVPDLAPVREALQQTRAELVHPSAREENVLFDTADGRLEASGRVLRLRRYGDQRLLTLKGPVSYQGGIKMRREDETLVADADRLQAILEDLGFEAVSRYEKDRESWRFGRMAVVLDHTPMGDFVEVEGPPEELAAAALSLGLDPDQAVRGSYPSLWREYRLRHPDQELPSDMVFRQ